MNHPDSTVVERLVQHDRAILICLGCCWALMLLLFAGGIMSLAVIGALTAVVLLEKLTRLGERGVRLIGVALVLLGLWVLAPAGTWHLSLLAGPTSL